MGRAGNRKNAAKGKTGRTRNEQRFGEKDETDRSKTLDWHA